ncbi:MAG: redoxin domain-containing protein [bacterium]|nr:MAG: redoxin domain-containing protein [bacterium]
MFKRALLCIIAILLLAPATWAQVSVGQPAPDFTYLTLSGDTISLSDYRGKVVYLFFFGYG